MLGNKTAVKQQKSKPMAKTDSKRAEILGGLIKNAREHIGRAEEDCALVLGVSPDKYQQIEAGKQPISLPELEALALYLNISMGYFWGSEPLPGKQELNYANLLALRHRVIGVQLNQLRLRTKKSQEEMAESTGIAVADLKAYETGQKAIPYLELELLCKELGTTVDVFLDDVNGPLGRHEAQQRFYKQFNRMSPEMQAFLVNPVNIAYLDTAKRISEMDVQKLRQVAENILEITY